MAKIANTFGFILDKDGVHGFFNNRVPPVAGAKIQDIAACLKVLHEVFPFWKGECLSITFTVTEKTLFLQKNNLFTRKFYMPQGVEAGVTALLEAFQHPGVIRCCEEGEFDHLCDFLFAGLAAQEGLE